MSAEGDRVGKERQQPVTVLRKAGRQVRFVLMGGEAVIEQPPDSA